MAWSSQSSADIDIDVGIADVGIADVDVDDSWHGMPPPPPCGGEFVSSRGGVFVMSTCIRSAVLIVSCSSVPV